MPKHHNHLTQTRHAHDTNRIPKQIEITSASTRKAHPAQEPSAAEHGNGIFDRYEHPVLTAEHTPLAWRYDFNHASNPHLMTRLGINCVFNVGAMEWNGEQSF